MAEIQTSEGISLDRQNEFILDGYRNFMYSAVYGFLFERLNLRELEIKYLGNGCQGFFAKNVLNMVGIDTSKSAGNCGRFAGMDVRAVAKDLVSDENPVICNIGRILLKEV